MNTPISRTVPPQAAADALPDRLADAADRVWALDYRAAVAMRYHARRRAFLESFSRLEPVLTLLLGSAAFAAAVSSLGALVPWLTLGTALVSALVLAFGTGERARLHERLFREWATFRATLARVDPADEAALRELEARRLELGADTPPQLHALTVLCQNEENEFRRSGERYEVSAFQRAVANLLTLPFARFGLIQYGP